MNEVWKYVINAGEQYEVSSYGRVRNATTKRVLRAFIGKDGYVRTQLGGLIRKTILVHREVAKAFLYKQDGKDFVNHIDGNKENNSATNLEWCTRSENMRHAYDNSLISAKAGTKNGRCKLSEEDVAFIINHYIPRDNEYGAKALGKRFGVAHQTICAIINGQNWRALPI